MKANSNTARANWRLLGWGAAGALFLLPAVLTVFLPEMNWGPGDFLVFGAMILALGAAVELAVRAARSPHARFIAIAGAAGLFLLVWAELAVGIF